MDSVCFVFCVLFIAFFFCSFDLVVCWLSLYGSMVPERNSIIVAWIFLLLICLILEIKWNKSFFRWISRTKTFLPLDKFICLFVFREAIYILSLKSKLLLKALFIIKNEQSEMFACFLIIHAEFVRCLIS